MTNSLRQHTHNGRYPAFTGTIVGTMPMLYHLIYVSDANDSKPFDMDHVLKAAKSFNEKAHVTGALWFDGKTFVQILEGSRAAVSQAFIRVLNSGSHKNIELVSFELAPERMFSDWSMAYFHGSAHENDIVRRFSDEGTFLPREMSPQSLTAFMRYLEVDRQVNAVHSI